MIYDPTNCYHKTFKEDCREFELLRTIAINDETNKNYYDFIPERLVLEDHIAYNVCYDIATNKPMAMGGLIEIQPGVGRMMNRYYIFPEFRNKTHNQFISGVHAIVEHIIKPLYEVSTFQTHVITMANRTEEANQTFWKIFSRAHKKVWPNHWHDINGYIQTAANPLLKRCWQNAITDNVNHSFEIIDHEEWLQLK